MTYKPGFDIAGPTPTNIIDNWARPGVKVRITDAGFAEYEGVRAYYGHGLTDEELKQVHVVVEVQQHPQRADWLGIVVQADQSTVYALANPKDPTELFWEPADE